MTLRLRHIALALPLLLAGCEQPEEPERFSTTTVTTRDIVVTVQAAGIIEPVTTVEVKSKASGEILELNAETGTVVSGGELLVQIDKRAPRNALAQAEAELEAAKARRSIAEAQSIRSEKLFESGTLNQVEYEQSILEFANSKAEVVRSEVSVENARIALEDTEVRSPIDGTVIEKLVEKGQVISSPTMDVGGGTPLLMMADLRSVQVKALVDETDIGKISPDLAALVTVAAYPNQPFQGQVIKIEPKAMDEEAVTMFSVLVTIDNSSGLLRPGMNAEVEINIASAFDVAAIPTIALRTPRDIDAAASFLNLEEDDIRAQLKEAGMETPDAASGASGNGNWSPPTDSYEFGGRYWVFTLVNDELRPRYVTTGITDLEYSEVRSGVSADDEIVLIPSSGLIRSQERFRKWMGEMTGVPGLKEKKKDEDK